MLPVINLHATDTRMLHSLPSFVTDQSSKLNVPTPLITFDQSLYVKAYNFVSSMNMNIFVRLGGFHQLISFLGSIGCLMEQGGRRAALEKCICSCYYWSYVFWQGFCPCNTWSYVTCFSSFITSLRRVLG